LPRVDDGAAQAVPLPELLDRDAVALRDEPEAVAGADRVLLPVPSSAAADRERLAHADVRRIGDAVPALQIGHGHAVPLRDGRQRVAGADGVAAGGRLARRLRGRSGERELLAHADRAAL